MALSVPTYFCGAAADVAVGTAVAVAAVAGVAADVVTVGPGFAEALELVGVAVGTEAWVGDALGEDPPHDIAAMTIATGPIQSNARFMRCR